MMIEFEDTIQVENVIENCAKKEKEIYQILVKKPKNKYKRRWKQKAKYGGPWLWNLEKRELGSWPQ